MPFSVVRRGSSLCRSSTLLWWACLGDLYHSIMRLAAPIINTHEFTNKMLSFTRPRTHTHAQLCAYKSSCMWVCVCVCAHIMGMLSTYIRIVYVRSEAYNVDTFLLAKSFQPLMPLMAPSFSAAVGAGLTTTRRYGGSTQMRARSQTNTHARRTHATRSTIGLARARTKRR